MTLQIEVSKSPEIALFENISYNDFSNLQFLEIEDELFALKEQVLGLIVSSMTRTSSTAGKIIGAVDLILLQKIFTELPFNSIMTLTQAALLGRFVKMVSVVTLSGGSCAHS